MNDKIDVLAVMDDHIAAAEAEGTVERYQAQTESMRQARAAIAELIYAAKDARDSLLAANKVYSDGAIGLLIERLSVTLESVGGA